MEDDAQSVWLYLSCGLVRIGRSELDAWASHPKQTIQVTVFDSSDGVSNHRFTGGYSPVSRKIRGWQVVVRAISAASASSIRTTFPCNKLPPPVHIEQITADDKTYDATNGLRLPPRVRNLAIDYTALSLVAPEKVRFRYKLEGQNRNWHEVVNDRQVTVHEPRTGHLPLPRDGVQQQWRVERRRRGAGVRRSRRRGTRRTGSTRSVRPPSWHCCGLRTSSVSGNWRTSSICAWKSGLANAHALPANCTTRCYRVFMALLLTVSGWIDRLPHGRGRRGAKQLRRAWRSGHPTRSRREAMRCRDCAFHHRDQRSCACHTDHRRRTRGCNKTNPSLAQF